MITPHDLSLLAPDGNLEWVREKTLLKRVQISRSRLYEGRKEGWVRYAILAKRGNLKGITVYHLPTFLAHFEKLAQVEYERNSPSKTKEAP